MSVRNRNHQQISQAEAFDSARLGRINPTVSPDKPTYAELSVIKQASMLECRSPPIGQSSPLHVVELIQSPIQQELALRKLKKRLLDL